MKKILCQNCGVKKATVLYRENNNGAERELHLCPECAARLGIGDFQDPFLSSFSLFSPHAAEPKRGAACPLCGTTLSQIQSSGKFGCSTCYDTFAHLLDLSPFIGKGYHGKNETAPKQQTPPDEGKRLSHSQTEPISEAEELKAQLQKAVAAEDYERAAVLRDQIRAKEGK